MFTPISVIEGITFPAVMEPRGALMLAMQYQLEKAQWWTPEQILEHQMQQLQNVIHHAATTVPFYRELYQEADIDINTIHTYEDFRKLPLASREQIQTAEKDLISTDTPKDHGPLSNIQTSGSSGRIVKLKGTHITQLMWSVLALRYQLWHELDHSGVYASLRLMKDRDTNTPMITGNGWGQSSTIVTVTGKSIAMDIRTGVDEQIKFMLENKINYLSTYPSNAVAIGREIHKRGLKPKLDKLFLFGETVTAEMREECELLFDAPVIDAYSCQEAGYIALQCPSGHKQYHIQSEALLVEVLDENDMPCQTGEIGRVVISSLNNFATPLIRYDIGDYAEVGEACDCGRGLPTLKRIMGRTRNMMVFPDGRTQWPVMGVKKFDTIAPIKQFQLVQKTVNDILLRLVPARELTSKEEDKLRLHIQKSLGHPFNIQLQYEKELMRSDVNGKFEDFKSELL